MWPTFYIPRRRGRYPTPVIVRTTYTTPPYPLEAVDSVQSSFGGVSGSFGRFFYPLSTVQTAWDIVSGTLRDILQSFDGGMDSIEASWTIVSGNLATVLRSISPDPEGVNSNWDIRSGELRRILISYTHPDSDNVQSSWTIVSGTLT